MSCEIDEFLGSYDPGIAQLSHQLRDFVKGAAPGCSETLHTGWKVLSYGQRKKFCAIAPHAKWVNLQFHAGAALTDDNNLLGGSGKSMRHAKVSTASGLNVDLADLIAQASGRGR